MTPEATRQKIRYMVTSIRTYINIRDKEAWSSTKKDAQVIYVVNKLKKAFDPITDNYTYPAVRQLIINNELQIKLLAQYDHRPVSNKVKKILNEIL